jgi:hypothetical protein
MNADSYIEKARTKQSSRDGLAESSFGAYLCKLIFKIESKESDQM